jgi:hypothetical protein
VPLELPSKSARIAIADFLDDLLAELHRAFAAGTGAVDLIDGDGELGDEIELLAWIAGIGSLRLHAMARVSFGI